MKEIWIVVLLLPIVLCLYNENAERDYNVADMNFTVCENPSRCISLYEEGNYGTKSSHDAVEGYLIHSSSLYGCKMFNFKVYRQPWIAFISRGECMFSEKINNAINHNASAVIIYNNKPTGSVTMIHENTGSVVAVSVSYAVGKEINSKLNNSSVFVKIAYDRHVSGRKFNTISVLFVSVSFIVLMVISLAWLVFYYVQRFRYLYARDKTERRLTTAAKKAIAKLHSRTVSKKDEEDVSDNSCAVCLEEYKSGEMLRTLPCNHEFHKHCVDPWLIEHRTCPMCKNNILKELGMLQPEDERLSSQDNDVTISVTTDDHGSALYNGGLVEELVPPFQDQDQDDEQNSQGSTSHLVCAVTPVETPSNWQPSFSKKDNSSNRRNSTV